MTYGELGSRSNALKKLPGCAMRRTCCSLPSHTGPKKSNQMSKMGEVFARYMEEKRYEQDLKADTYLQRVAYSKGYTQQPADKATTKKDDGKRNK